VSTSSSSSATLPDPSEHEEKSEPFQHYRHSITSDHLDAVKSSSSALARAISLQNASRSELRQHQISKTIKKFQKFEGDTGSSAVQIAVLTDKIAGLKAHLKVHKKDQPSKRGLDGMMSKRRKLLQYLERKDFDEYRKVVLSLGLVKK